MGNNGISVKVDSGKNRDSKHYIFSKDKTPVANITIRCSDYYIAISDIIVDKKYRGNGIGKECMKLMEEDLKKLGYGGKDVIVASYPHTEGFYASCGFEPTGERDFMEVWMSKMLT